MLVEDIIAVVLFLGSSGLLFSQKFRENKLMVLFAGLIALVSTYYLTKDVARDIAIEVYKEQAKGGSKSDNGREPPPPRPVAQVQLAPAVQEAVDRARESERNARKRAAEAREAERKAEVAAAQGRDAAQKAEAHTAGYTVWESDPALKQRYEGQVSQDGTWSGAATAWSLQDRYEGEYRQGTYNGNGIYLYHDATIYRGEFRAGIENGVGVRSWPNGDRFEGQNDGGKVNGEGVYYGGSDKTYRQIAGQVKDDQVAGYAIYYWKDGTVSMGEWLGSERNGYGAKFDAGGKLLEQGYYESDKLKTAMSP